MFKEILTTVVLYFNKETKCNKNKFNDPQIVKILEWQYSFLQQFMGRAYPEE